MIRDGLIAAELVAVHDLDGGKAATFADRLHLERKNHASDVAAVSDAVYVCTSTGGHLEAVRAAASAGRAIFCEKPLARSLTESRALVRLVEEAGVPAQAGLVLRTAPVYRELARLVTSGRLGRPMVAVLRDDQFFPIQGHYASTWRKDVTEAGAGALMEHSIHDVDIARVCFGEVASVAAMNANVAGFEGIEDVAAGLLRFESGLVVNMVSAWHSVMTRPSTRRVEVFFERGFVSFDDDFTGPITIQTDEGTEVRRVDPAPFVADTTLPEGRVGLGVRPYLEENRDFVDALIASRPPTPALAEALRAHEVVDAWYRSAAEGGAVTPACYN